MSDDTSTTTDAPLTGTTAGPEVTTAPSGDPLPTLVGPTVMHFDVEHPGFIPEGVIAEGVSGSATVVVGFIPEGETAPGQPGPGKCPYCAADFSDRPDPAASLKGHLRAKHKE